MYAVKKIALAFVLFFKLNTFAQQNVIEVNPLILANSGLGFNGEFLLTHYFSLGSSMEFYYQTPFNYNGVQATRNMLNIAPFIRYYFAQNELQGFFIGLKINSVYSKSKISDYEVAVIYNNFYVAPTTHFGYRFVYNQFTLSAYTGLGIKSSSNQFPRSYIPASRLNNNDWLNAQKKLNENVYKIQPDYGLTLGYIF